MSAHLRKLARLLHDALEKGLIEPEAVEQLTEMAEDRERNSGILSLASVLAWLGGIVLGVGVMLIVAANWSSIPNLLKVASSAALVVIAHGAGMYLRWRTELRAFAEAMNLLGAVLFLGALALIAEVFDIQGRPPNLFLFWLLGTAPLAWALRSPALSFASIFALTTWMHMEQFGGRFGHDPSFTMAVLVELGLGVALIGFAAMLREPAPEIARVFRGVALAMLFYAVYMMGFYRFLSWHRTGWLSAVPSAAALVLGGVGLGLGYRRMLPDNPYLRDRLVILLSSVLVIGLLMGLTDLRVLPEGPELRFTHRFGFGWRLRNTLGEWSLSMAAWALWFTLAMWCVFFASRTGRKNYLNAGVLAVGLGVVTRFFDLIGGMFQTGMIFILGGGLLLATCLIVERWRRRALKILKESDEARRKAALR